MAELMTMDIRVQAFWVREAEALERRHIASIARGVNIGMATGDGYKQGMDELELSISRQEREDALWEKLRIVGRK